jgi:peptide/nickel transport system ATP-binding protein
MTLLKIDDLKVEFPGRHDTFVAVEHIHLELEPGEIYGLVGESGAGKSTIGNAVIDLLEPPGHVAEGHISLDGMAIEHLPYEKMRAIRGRRIGMIFQDPLTSLNPLYTVEQQLIETIQTHLNLSDVEAAARAIELLQQVGIPEPEVRVKLYPHQFSGGMRQRVVIALALCGEPELIIADEPTTALDVSIQAQILDLIRKLCKERQMGMIIITHDMGVIADITDNVAVMYRGQIVEKGPTQKILGAPEHPYTKSLISAVPRADLRLTRFPMVHYIEGPEPARADFDVTTHWLGQSRNFGKSDGPLVRVESLTMQFVTARSIFPSRQKVFTAVDNVSFEIREGETFGLVGESGSGKSTVARTIAGLYRPAAGSIHFAGGELTAIKSEKLLRPYRQQMQMIFQDPYSSLNSRMRVLDIVAEPIRFHKLASSRDEVVEIVEDLLEHVGLGRAAARRFPHEFSGGQRQRISIARALATRPRFLICDEPTSALDVSIQAQILNLLKDLQEELGLTMLFISHDLPVIRQMCDRVAVMRRGKICEIAETEQLFEAPGHAYTRHLLDLMPKLEGLSREGLQLADENVIRNTQ